jgi:hypothetical protein
MQKGDNLLIEYGYNSIKNVSTFLYKRGNENHFINIKGEFILTDQFIDSNKIKINVIED